MARGKGNGIRMLRQLRELCDVDEHGDSACWMWTGGISRGRPTCRVKGLQVAGPRMTAVALGRDHERTEGLRWTARCGNALCIAPHHLVLVTPVEMMAIVGQAGRLKRSADTVARSRAAAAARPTTAPASMVIEARESDLDAKALAAKFGVSATAVKQWRNGKRRADVIAGPFAALLRSGL